MASGLFCILSIDKIVFCSRIWALVISGMSLESSYTHALAYLDGSLVLNLGLYWVTAALALWKLVGMIVQPSQLSITTDDKTSQVTNNVILIHKYVTFRT